MIITCKYLKIYLSSLIIVIMETKYNQTMFYQDSIFLSDVQFYFDFLKWERIDWIYIDTSKMEHFNQLLSEVNAFIRGDDFFHYHGLVLGSAWLIGSVIAILARKVSVTLHAFLFFLIDASTAFFLVGAMLRVYPYIPEKWDVWPLIKKGHFIGGGVFLVMMIIQHIGGVSTLLKGQKYNPGHRLFGFYVSNFGRILAFFGFVIAKAEQWVIISSGVITLVLLIASTYKVFFTKKEKRPVSEASASPTATNSNNRSKSPKRD